MFNEFVASTRIRAARNVSGYALPAGTDDEVGVRFPPQRKKLSARRGSSMNHACRIVCDHISIPAFVNPQPVLCVQRTEGHPGQRLLLRQLRNVVVAPGLIKVVALHDRVHVTTWFKPLIAAPTASPTPAPTCDRAKHISTIDRTNDNVK